nr:uncharacterized protein CI109_005241 [Kwoniella shandongensis]KAA5526471.1 hypothetical protein CI109_005241 [Kwoniella shandongensis]
MSWKTAPGGKLLSGPPTLSSSSSSSSDLPVGLRLRPNSHSLTAHQRETLLATYSNPAAILSELEKRKRSEWDVVKENHRFIRDDEEPTRVSWEERVARAYESKLFKEFALIDLKHYKSKQLALRWRTAPEVVNGIGEDTCASLRCKYHQPLSDPHGGGGEMERTPGIRFRGFGFGFGGSESESATSTPTPGPSTTSTKNKEMPALKSFELPFVYAEAGERKEALVKVRLCPKCVAKLVWKPSLEDKQHGERHGSKSEDGGKRVDGNEKRNGRDDSKHDRNKKEDRGSSADNDRDRRRRRNDDA